MGILTRLAVIWVAGVNYFFLPKVLIVAGHMGGDRAGVVRHSERQRAERWSQRRLVRRPARGSGAARGRLGIGVGLPRPEVAVGMTLRQGPYGCEPCYSYELQRRVPKKLAS